MRKIVFMFSGQGSQYANMGIELYKSIPVFRNHMESLDSRIKEVIGESVIDKIYVDDASKFKRMKYTHLGIFMVEYSLLETLKSYGIKPDTVVGASMGEYTACIAAGILKLEDVINLLVNQSSLVESKCKPGCMMTILHDKKIWNEIKSYNEKIELVTVNYDRHFVVSGSKDDIYDLKQHLKKNGVITQILDVNYGYHSYMIDEVEEDYRKYISSIEINSPKIQYMSGSKGMEIKGIDVDYLWEVVRKKICFAEAIKALEEEKDTEHVYVDLGPSSTLVNYVKKNISKDSTSIYFPIMSLYNVDLKNLEKLKEFFSVEKEGEKVIYSAAFVGQGSQRRGMGKDLLNLDEFKTYVDMADNILGYSIKELCLEDKENKLNLTQYSQPALYVVNSLMYLKYKKDNGQPEYVLGHSLGEYCALFAAGVFDFETGLKIVKKRGELMGKQNGGKMLAMLGKTSDEIKEIIKECGLDGKVDFANYNEPYQTVISGSPEYIDKAVELLDNMDGLRCVPLNVSAAFHSRYMKEAAREFKEFINQFEFKRPSIKIISNYTAKPYKDDEIKENMVNQMFSSVRWVESIEYLLDRDLDNIVQMGEGDVINKLTIKIKKAYVKKEPIEDIDENENINEQLKEEHVEEVKEVLEVHDDITNILGSTEFKNDFNLKYAYVAGPMYRGVSGRDMVVSLAKSGMLGFIGSTYMKLEDLRHEISAVKKSLINNESFGVGFSYRNDEQEIEKEVIELLTEEEIKIVNFSGYIQITEELAKYRIKSLYKSAGKIYSKVKFIMKVSRPEIARMFMEPIPENIIKKLLDNRDITNEEAELAKNYPVVDSICIEANCAGYTEGKSINCLLPQIIHMRDICVKNNDYDCNIYIGAAGGIGTDMAAMSMFIIGADYIMTGSINQCTVEAKISDEVKNKLQNAEIEDIDYAPGIDWFEFGSKVQVLKRGSFFCVKANKLYELYKRYNSLMDIDSETKERLISKYFLNDFETIYSEMYRTMPQDEVNEKKKMAMVFKWYLINSQLFALNGDEDRRVDYQIYCSSAMGAFNEWVKGSSMEQWRNRHVQDIGKYIMDGAESLLKEKLSKYKEFI